MKRLVKDERGTTLVELMVGTAAGLVVLFALTTALVVSMSATARVSARVHATQDARVLLTRIMEDLHSACVSPKIAPIQAGSNGTTLRFVHSSPSEGSSAVINPILSVISLSDDTLSMTDYPSMGGTPPTFSSTPTGTRQLGTDIGPTPPSSSIFNYFSYSKGKLVEIPQQTLDATGAVQAIQVRVAFSVTPSSADRVSANVQNSAMLRLTPPSFNEEAAAFPCQ